MPYRARPKLIWTPGVRLKKWRERQDPELTVAQAAKKFGVSWRTWTRYEDGTTLPPLHRLRALHELTGIPILKLLPE